jgi:hypothetical protein
MECKCPKCHKIKNEEEFILENGSIGITCYDCRCLSQTYARRQAKERLPPRISRSTVCATLHSHSVSLHDDPDHLPTEFIKTLLFRKKQCEAM